MVIDIVSVIFVIALCGLFLCVALALTVDWAAPEPGTRWWIVGFAVLSTGFCVNGLQNHLPALLGLTLANMLLVGGLGVLLIGTQRFLSAPTRYEPWVIAAVLVTATTSVLLLYAWPSVNGRMAVGNTIMAGLLAAYAHLLLHHAPRLLYAPARLTAAAAIVIAVLLALRVAAVLMAPPLASPFQFNLINALVYLGVALAQLVLGLACYFMLTIRRTAALQALLASDPLTKSLKRRGLEVATARVEHDFRRNWTVFSVVTLDIDHFERINQAHGDAVGDAVLQRLADESRRQLRGDSVIARLGENEFCILLPGCKRDDAYTVAERIRVAFAAARIESGGVSIESTVSMGVAQCHARAPDFVAVCKEADAALLRAKEGGRNRVEKAPMVVDAAPAR